MSVPLFCGGGSVCVGGLGHILRREMGHRVIVYTVHEHGFSCIHVFPETFYFIIFPFAHSAFTVHSPCSFVFTNCSHSLFTKRSLCAHHAFIICSEFSLMTALQNVIQNSKKKRLIFIRRAK